MGVNGGLYPLQGSKDRPGVKDEATLSSPTSRRCSASRSARRSASRYLPYSVAMGDGITGSRTILPPVELCARAQAA